MIKDNAEALEIILKYLSDLCITTIKENSLNHCRLILKFLNNTLTDIQQNNRELDSTSAKQTRSKRGTIVQTKAGYLWV